MIYTARMNDKKSRYLYETIWGSPLFDFPTEKTIVNGLPSENSYTLTGVDTPDEDICAERLADIFGIDNKALFRSKLHSACSGDGQEIKRIGTLHSSALCALLFFYNVTPEHPLILDVNGKSCIFTHSVFEFQNKVINNPSNMDITLVGRYADTDKPVILFLESKFSEYMSKSKSLWIAEAYLHNKYSKDIYNQLDKTGITIDNDIVKGKFSIKSDNFCYLEGIKQMISHFVGVNNFIDGHFVIRDEVVLKARESADIYLGAILFDKGIGNFEAQKDITCYQAYKEKYEKLADLLNTSGRPVHVIRQLFSYTMFENSDFIKEDKIKQFYFKSGK